LQDDRLVLAEHFAGRDTEQQGITDLTGGTGDDLFVFNNHDGDDVITDFSAGAGSPDVIEFSSHPGFASFADVQAAASNDGFGNTIIDLGGGNSLTLEGVSAASLHTDDFLFS